jgi:hypothetical protein
MNTQIIQPEYANQLLGEVRNIPLQCQTEAYYGHEHLTQRETVLECLKELGEATDRELLNYMNAKGITIEKNALTGRRRELALRREVIEVGKKDYKLGSKTFKNTIWKAI